MESLDLYLKEKKRLVERALDAALPSARTAPTTLHRAMRYVLLGGGKRLRPIFCLAAAEACRGEVSAALPAACAVECLHTYSLVHDDLPCMDDDDLRRGRPTCHKVFGEGIAVLVGDALLTEAFALLTQVPPARRYQVRDYVHELARAAGSRNLIAGQVADLEAEGRTISRRQLHFIHEGKTAAMVVASLRLGAMSANASPGILEALTDFGQNLGLAFQAIDDILDVTQSSATLGKSAGKDQKAAKSTYPSLLGLEAARREATCLTRRAIKALDRVPQADRLSAMAARLLEREF